MEFIRILFLFTLGVLRVHAADNPNKASMSIKCALDFLEGDAYLGCMKEVEDAMTAYYQRDSGLNLFTYCCSIKAFKTCMVTLTADRCGNWPPITEYTAEWVDEKVAFYLGNGGSPGVKHVCSQNDYQFASCSPLCWPTWAFALWGTCLGLFLVFICIALGIYLRRRFLSHKKTHQILE